MRIISTLVCAITLLSLTIGGCPQPTGAENTQVGPSSVPGGIYQGVLRITSELFVGGELLDRTVDESFESIAFSNQGIPLDAVSGEPERPGLEATFELGPFSGTEITQNVTTSGNQVTVRYDLVVRMTGPNGQDLRLSGLERVNYTYRNGKLNIVTRITAASEPTGGEILHLESEGVGTFSTGDEAQDGPSNETSEADALDTRCPLSVDKGLGFSLLVPCTAVEERPSNELPNAEFESYYFDSASGFTYIAASLAVDDLPVFSNTTNLPALDAFRFDGIMRSSHGVNLILATGHLTTGAVVRYAYGELQGERLLMLGTDEVNPLAGSFFSSVRVDRTDPSQLPFKSELGPFLRAPATDRVILLDNGVAYRSNAIQSLNEVTEWKTNDSVYLHEAPLLLEPGQVFLTNRSRWFSIPAVRIGTVETEGKLSAPITATVMEIDDGSVWDIQAGNVPAARLWKAGQQIVVFADETLRPGYAAMNLATGRVIEVTPG